ncbi:hypothetical protein BT96DRAFT_1001797 [Gymnopus androsaceus JB14]|uniref:Uncharacterized protein n=1 Tax=Gymnopus androsaceus JB14 TaxID=1447944 RepID=A0A6A4GZQ1_9AGAR|nr:hypothetical protein BT96DRAFT_1001797 [Gymnopus androsaceus JB14]
MHMVKWVLRESKWIRRETEWSLRDDNSGVHGMVIQTSGDYEKAFHAKGKNRSDKEDKEEQWLSRHKGQNHKNSTDDEDNEESVQSGVQDDSTTMQQAVRVRMILFFAPSMNCETCKANNLSPRRKAVLDLFKSQVIRHIDIHNNALEALEFLTRLPLHYLGKLPDLNLLTCAPQWSKSHIIEYGSTLLWADILAMPIEDLAIVNRAVGMSNFFTHTDIVANWQTGGEPLKGSNPHINLISVFHNSADGLKLLEIQMGGHSGIILCT